MLCNLGSDFPEELKEVMLNDADDVEAIGNDFCIGEVSFDESTVGGAQVNADHAHLFPAVQGLQETFEVPCAFALGDIKDAVVAQITEGGGEATPFVQSVFVDAEELGAEFRAAFTGLLLSELMIDAFDGGATEFGKF